MTERKTEEQDLYDAFLAGFAPAIFKRPELESSAVRAAHAIGCDAASSGGRPLRREELVRAVERRLGAPRIGRSP